LEALVDPATRGDPESPVRWTCKSTYTLARELTKQGHPVSARTVGRLLRAGFACDIEPCVHVKRSREIPRKRWAFELPDAPDTVIAEVVFLEERQTQSVDPSVTGEALANFLRVDRAEGPQHHLQELIHHRLLLALSRLSYDNRNVRFQSTQHG
jgi:hypothetical protein